MKILKIYENINRHSQEELDWKVENLEHLGKY